MANNARNNVNIKSVKKYWALENIPQRWYAVGQPGSLQYYNQVSYERYKKYYPYLRDVAEFSDHAGEKVLEIGVGLGTDLIEFSKGGAHVYGIDLGEDQIRLSNEHFIRKEVNFKDLRVASAEELPYPDNYFDVVYSFGVLHHTPDIVKAIDEISRVLTDDGIAIIMLYAKGWKHYIKRCLIQGIFKLKFFRFGCNWQAVYNDVSEVNGGSPLTRVFSKSEVKMLFKNFEIYTLQKDRLGEFFEYAPYNTSKFPEFLSRFAKLFALERMIGENWIIKVRKKKMSRGKLSEVIFKHY